MIKTTIQTKLEEIILKKLTEAKTAEAAVIASIILDDSQYDYVKNEIGPESFSDQANKILFQAIRDCFEDFGRADGVLLRDKLQESGQLDKIGGVDYLQKVVNSVPSAANCQYYTEIVKNHRIFRELVDKVAEANDILAEEKPTSEKLTSIKQMFERIDGDIISNSMPVIRNLAGVKSEPITWLWPYYIPMGMLSIVQGNAGLGKSMLVQKIISIATTAGTWPNCNGNPVSKVDKCRVLILDAENPVSQVTVPRLTNMGADLGLIDLLDSVIVRDEGGRKKQELVNLQRDILAIEKGIKPETKIVVIDPLSAYFGNGIDSNNNTDVRGVLRPLSDLAERTGVAIIAITHLNKNSAGRAIHRGLGSIAFTAAARAVWQVSDDPDDPKNGKRYLTAVKINISKEPAGLVFSIDDNGTVVFEGETDKTADECLTGSTVTAEKLTTAIQWLKGNTTVGDGYIWADLTEKAKEAGISPTTLQNAKKTAGIVSYWQIQPDGKKKCLVRRKDNA